MTTEGLEGIAIIGIACRFPGAGSPDAFWQNLRDGVESVTRFSDQELRESGVDEALLASPNYVKARTVLEGVDQFDPEFFGYSRGEAELIDPQQRVFLECCWEALERAGYDPAGQPGAVGVFAGAGLNTYMLNNLRPPGLFDVSALPSYQAFVANDKDFLATRVAYKLNLRGPSLTVQTACSTSLVAVHLACQSLLSYESDMALAGGVTVTVPHRAGYLYHEGMIVSPDGHCRAFDAAAQGCIFGSGAGVVLLKRLSDALADGDPVWAVVRGTAVNNDGSAKIGYTAPSVDGQAEVIMMAQSVAQTPPDTIGYVEAHGTATRLGDPIEVAALTQAFRAQTERSQFCALGSVKTNIGHTDAAAGIAGLIKTALALKHRQIPPSLNFREPNPEIDFASSPFYVNTALADWPEPPHPRRAGVSAFGVGGTNAHVILEEAPAEAAPPAAPEQADAPLRLLPLSARSPESLLEYARRMHTFLSSTPDSAADVCATASLRRRHYDERLALAGRSAAELAAQLDAFVRGQSRPGLAAGRAAAPAERRVVFVCPGHGSQWFGMARGLLASEPVFRAELERCAAAFRPLVDWSLLEQLQADEAGSRLGETAVIQPVVFAIQIGLAALWQSWGITPAAVVGHSMGEIAAAYIAGALSLEDAAAVICHRSALLMRVRGQGAMAVVDLTMEQAQAAIGERADRLVIGVSNSPRSTVLSGDPAALDEVLAELERRAVFCRRVKIDVASHSPQMDPLCPELRRAVAGVRPREARLPFYSTVERRRLDGPELDADYWVRNLRQTVLFADTLQLLAAEGHRIFVELSPHPLLAEPIRQCLGEQAGAALVLPSLRRDEDERLIMLGSLGALYTRGLAVEWGRLLPEHSRRAALPNVPWVHGRYWIDPAPAQTGAAAGAPAGRWHAGGHPLLGRRLDLTGPAESFYWEQLVGVAELPYLADHRVQGTIVVPGAVFMELALSAALEAYGPGAHEIGPMDFLQVLILPEQGARLVQVALTPAGPGLMQISISSRSGEGGAWALHARGALRPAARSAAPAPYERPEAIQARCREIIGHDQIYQMTVELGFGFGPSFRTIAQLWQGQDEALGRLRLPEPLAGTEEPYTFHPTLLDSGVQLVNTISLRQSDGTLYLPGGFGQMRYHQQRPGREIWGHVRFRRDGAARAGGVAADLTLFDEQQVILEAQHFRLEPLERAEETFESWLYELAWQSAPRPANAALAGRWLLLDDQAGLGAALGDLLAGRGARVVRAGRGPAYQRVSADAYQLSPDQPEHFQRLLADAFGAERPCAGVIYLWGAAEGADDQPLARLREQSQQGCAGLLHLTQALARADWRDMPRLWVVTRGVQPLEGAPGALALPQAALWGMARTLVYEHPDLRCACADLGARGAAEELELLADELAADSEEDLVALRGAGRYVARLAPARPAAGAAEPAGPAGATPFRLEQSGAGEPALRAAARPLPGPGEVLVEVQAAVLSAPAATLGQCAGRIAALGADVRDLAVGDAVVALTEPGLATHVLAPAALVAPKPAGLSFEAAAAPLAFLAAYHQIHQLGQVRPGERVLVRAGAAGAGLAALLLARQAGAQVAATARGAEEHALLERLGVRALAEADADAETFDLIIEGAPERPAADPARGLAAAAGAAAGIAAVRPETIPALLRQALRALEPVVSDTPAAPVFPIQALEAALRGARAAGSVVVSLHGREQTPILAERAAAAVRPDGAYLISGGLGGIGLALAEWLVAQGARELVLVGRRGADPAAQPTLARLEAQGAHVTVARADVADEAQIGAVIAALKERQTPLRGVFHAAGVLDDRTVLRLEPQHLRAVIAPKLDGGWNLHRLTLDQPLDCFVLFSSASALMGSPGQANYAAANAALDALAHYRRARGLPALSINWSRWGDVGMVAQDGQSEQLAARGIEPIPARQGLALLGRLLRGAQGQIGVVPFNLRQWSQFYPNVAAAPFLSLLMQSVQPGGAGGGELRPQLQTAAPAERAALIHGHLRELFAQVLRLDPRQLGLHTPFTTLGLDSLMGLEVRNRLERSFGLSLSAVVIWAYPTIAGLAGHLAEQLGLALEETPAAPAPEAAADAPDEETSDLDSLSSDELAAMLSDKLAFLEEDHG